MNMKRGTSLNLFFGVGIVFLFLTLVSLPGLAGTSIDISTTISATYTSTISSLLPLIDQDNLKTPTITNIIISNSSAISPTLLAITFPITDTITPSPTYTSTPTFTPTTTSTPTVTLTPSLTPTETPTPQPTIFMLLPFLSKQPTYTPTPIPPPPEQILYCDHLDQRAYIPDDNAPGVNDEISISDGRLLVNLSLYLNISHNWVGDLEVTLTNQNTGEKITVLDRPGIPTSQFGCSNDNIIAILDDAAAQSAENKCAYSPAISGIYLPEEALSAFSGRSASGAWILNISDHDPGGTGWLNHWCLETLVSDSMPASTPTPTPVSLPASAYVNGMSGQDQQLNLDCESRSAVDWAKHFGLNIGELDFVNHLPGSDDPDAGFVGDPDGIWGHTPPDDYGVHAYPIADLLRDYGAIASSYRSLQWDDLRAEIASGRPVIVWIIGGSSYNLVNGIPHFYTAETTGDTTIVAPWEHTVILVGYTPTSVTVLNGSKLVDVSLNQFLDSWSVLQFMAVLARP
jgi:subtilisin-like proprotein convertase family protein